MQLVNPNALYWLLISVPIIVLYLLHRKPRRAVVSTNMFWEELLPETTPRRWWQRLRNPLSLLVTLLLLALLVLSIAEPRFSGRVIGPQSFVVVIDNSASMQAKDDTLNQSRFATAKAQVETMIDRLRDDDEMTLVTSAPSPKQLIRATASHQRLRHALNAIRVCDAPTDASAAIDLARRLSHRDSTHKTRAFFFTDGQSFTDGQPARIGQAAAVSQESSSPEVDVLPAIQTVGRAADNIAITKFQVRRPLDDPVGFELFVELQSFSNEPSSGELEVSLTPEDDRHDRDSDGSNEAAVLLEVVPFSVAPGMAWTRVIRGQLPDGGQITGRLANAEHQPWDDALEIDNQAVSLLPAQEANVLLITPGNRYLEQAIRSMVWVQCSTLNSIEKLTSDSLSQLASGTVIVVDDILQQGVADRWLDPILRKRSDLHVLFVRPSNIQPLWEMEEELPPQPMTVKDNTDPLLRHVKIEGQNAYGTRRCRLLADGWRVSLTADDNVPVIAYGAHQGGGRCLLLNLDVAAGNFAWRTSFPIFISNALQWLSGQAESADLTYRAGEALPSWVAECLRDDKQAVLTSPSGRQINRMDHSGLLDEVGVWRIRRTSTQDSEDHRNSSSRFACNLANDVESNLLEGGDTEVSLDLATQHSRPIWFYAIVLALTASVIEWTLIQRRWLT